MTHPDGRIEAALRAAERYADIHRDAEGTTTEEGGMLLQLVSIITSQADRLAELEAALRAPVIRKADYQYRVLAVENVVDGDTVDLTIDLIELTIDPGFRLNLNLRGFLTATYRFRLLDVDAFEKNKPGGKQATEFVRLWLATPDGEMWVRSFKDASPDPDSFGRWLIQLEDRVDGSIVHSLNADLISAGHAVPYRKS